MTADRKNRLSQGILAAADGTTTAQARSTHSETAFGLGRIARLAATITAVLSTSSSIPDSAITRIQTPTTKT